MHKFVTKTHHFLIEVNEQKKKKKKKKKKRRSCSKPKLSKIGKYGIQIQQVFTLCVFYSLRNFMLNMRFITATIINVHAVHNNAVRAWADMD